MNRWFFKFMFCLYISMLIVACASGNHTPIVPTPTLVKPTPIPITPTPIPATAILAISASTPTIAIPTFSFNNLTPFATPTSVGAGPFNVVVGIDEIFPGSEWTYLQSAQGGTVWLLTDKGIAHVSDAGWTVYLSDYDGYLVGMDSTNRAWVISEAGDSISAWDGAKWAKYSSANGWTTVNDPQSFNQAYLNWNTNNFTELPGQVWISTREDVRRFDGVRWKIFTPKEMGMTLRSNEDITSAPPITSILEIEAIQSTGEIWVGECDSEPFISLPYDGSGARWFDGKSWQGKSTSVESGCVPLIQEDKAGNIWMAVNFSLWRFTPSTQAWVNFTLTEFSADCHSYIIDLVISDAGEPWLSTQALCNGGGNYSPLSTLYHLEDGVWRLVGVGLAFPPHDILIDLAGHAWLVGMQGVPADYADYGIYTIVDNYPQLVSDLTVNDLTMDTTGRIWVIGKASQEDKDSLWVATP